MLSARTQIRVEWQRYEIEEEVCAWDGSAGGEEVPLPLHKKNRSRSDPFLKYIFLGTMRATCAYALVRLHGPHVANRACLHVVSRLALHKKKEQRGGEK